MKKIEEKILHGVDILNQLSVFDINFTKSRKERLALTLLAVSNIKPSNQWSEARYWTDSEKNRWSCTTREIISFWNKNYALNISSGSYDDVRRKNLVYLVEAGLVDRSVGNPNANTNNPTRSYALNEDAGLLLRSYGTNEWDKLKSKFIDKYGKLYGRLERLRHSSKMPVSLPDGTSINFSTGEHNLIQKAVIEEFLPRFLDKPRLLYVGDTSNKFLFVDSEKLKSLSIPDPKHDKLPDIIAFDEKKKWIFFIEAVHSSNPISRIRHLELERISSKCKHGVVFVSAFMSRKTFKDWLIEISWETEVWIVDSPEHMIHFNGGKFLGPY